MLLNVPLVNLILLHGGALHAVDVAQLFDAVVVGLQLVNVGQLSVSIGLGLRAVIVVKSLDFWCILVLSAKGWGYMGRICAHFVLDVQRRFLGGVVALNVRDRVLMACRRTIKIRIAELLCRLLLWLGISWHLVGRLYGMGLRQVLGLLMHRLWLCLGLRILLVKLRLVVQKLLVGLILFPLLGLNLQLTLLQLELSPPYFHLVSLDLQSARVLLFGNLGSGLLRLLRLMGIRHGVVCPNLVRLFVVSLDKLLLQF